MSEETKDGVAVEEQQDRHEHVHGPDCDHEQDHEEAGIEPIVIELDDLSDEARQKAEKRLGRALADIEYKVVEQQRKEGSVEELKIEMPRSAFDNEQQLLLKDLSKDVTLPGFRKGKAPLALLRKRLGEDANRDTVRALAINALRQEQVKQEFKHVAKPQVTDFELTGETLSYTLEVEVEPKIEIKQFKGVEIEAEERPVGEEQVAARLEELRRQHSFSESAGADHKLTPGDTLVVDVVVTSESGERLEHLCRDGRTIYNYREELPEAIAERLEGNGVGAVIEASVPQKTTNRKGEELIHNDQWSVTIKEVKLERLPELDDEFAKDLGEDSLDALRAKVREDLEKQEAQRHRGEALGKLYRKLIELNEVDAPRSMLARKQYDLIMEDTYQLQRMGLKLENVVKDVDRYLHDQRASAGEMVRINLLMTQLRKQENLEIAEADVDAEIERIAAESGRKPLAVRARLEAQRQLEPLRNELAQRKLADFMLANNTIKKVAPKAAEETATEPADEDAGEAEATPTRKKSRKKKTDDAAAE